MDVIENKSDKELLQSLLAEIAKAQNEIRCAQGDILKAQNRIRFATMLVNELIQRK
jgi:hypothetical protein